LEFKLHKLKFVQLLESEGKMIALKYARSEFGYFADTDKKGIQELMGALVYMDSNMQTNSGSGMMLRPSSVTMTISSNNNNNNKHYSFLLDDSAWAEIVLLFTKEAGALQGFSVSSPLAAW
jgi:hypothetical protein